MEPLHHDPATIHVSRDSLFGWTSHAPHLTRRKAKRAAFAARFALKQANIFLAASNGALMLRGAFPKLDNSH